MRWAAAVVVAAVGGLLFVATVDLPRKGHPGPASVGVAASYTERALADTKTPNVVTAVLGDYRSYDTMGEAMVVFSAALACLLVLAQIRNPRAPPQQPPERNDGQS